MDNPLCRPEGIHTPLTEDGQTMEIVFADSKAHCGLRRFSGRGLWHARPELASEIDGAPSARVPSIPMTAATRE